MGLSIENMLLANKQGFAVLVWFADRPGGTLWQYLDEHFDHWDRTTGSDVAFFVDPLTAIRQRGGRVVDSKQLPGLPKAYLAAARVSAGEMLDGLRLAYQEAIGAALRDVTLIDTSAPTAFIRVREAGPRALVCRLDQPEVSVPAVFDAVLRSVDGGMPQLSRLRDYLGQAGMRMSVTELDAHDLHRKLKFAELEAKDLVKAIADRAIHRFSDALHARLNGVSRDGALDFLDALAQLNALNRRPYDDETDDVLEALFSQLTDAVRTTADIAQLARRRMPAETVDRLQKSSVDGIGASEAFLDVLERNPQLGSDLLPMVLGYLRALELEQRAVLAAVGHAAPRATMAQTAIQLARVPWPGGLREEIAQLANETRRVAEQRNQYIHHQTLSTRTEADTLRTVLGADNAGGLIPATVSFAMRLDQSVVADLCSRASANDAHRAAEAIRQDAEDIRRDNAKDKVLLLLHRLSPEQRAFHARALIEKLGEEWLVERASRQPWVRELLQTAAGPPAPTNE